MSKDLWDWTYSHIPFRQGGYTLDLDSSVMTRYGKQQGAKKGYNPKKPGRPSHRPLFAFLAEARIIANLWLRSGNTADVSGVNHFLAETLAKIPKHIEIKAIRADSGFHDQKFFAWLEKRLMKYAVAVRMDRRIQKKIAAAVGWVQIDEHREITEINYQALNWDKPRRMVVVRELIRPGKDNRGKMLFYLPDYTFSAVLTNMEDEPVEVWRFYNHRADAENRIKEFRDDFGASGFCLNSFYGTEAAMRLIALLFNIIALFKKTILKDPRPTLKNIRYHILIVGAVLGARARKKVLKISASGKLKDHLKSLLNRLDNYHQSQLQCSWVEE